MKTLQDTNTEKHQEQIILRDHLAAHRTEMANDRTFYAAIRTALTCLVAGVSLIKFFGNLLMVIFGWILLPVGIFIFIKGFLLFRKTRKAIIEEEENPSKIFTSGNF